MIPWDAGQAAHDAAEAHLNAIWEAETGEREDSPESAPFCGCQTCIIREVLHAAWPVFEASLRQN